MSGGRRFEMLVVSRHGFHLLFCWQRESCRALCHLSEFATRLLYVSCQIVRTDHRLILQIVAPDVDELLVQAVFAPYSEVDSRVIISGVINPVI